MQRVGAPAMFGLFAGVVLAGWAAAWLIDLGVAAAAARRHGRRAAPAAGPRGSSGRRGWGKGGVGVGGFALVPSGSSCSRAEDEAGLLEGHRDRS
jgi:hypothetical protein